MRISAGQAPLSQPVRAAELRAPVAPGGLPAGGRQMRLHEHTEQTLRSRLTLRPILKHSLKNGAALTSAQFFRNSALSGTELCDERSDDYTFAGGMSLPSA